MIIESLQLLSCATLAAAAIRWRIRHRAGEGAHRSLFPFIIAAGVMGCVLVVSYMIESFVAYYSGSIFEVRTVTYRFDGSYQWVYLTVILLPLLPISGLLPAVGKRPLLMAVIAVLAMIPAVCVRAIWS
jgi:uncharacterized membrane protein YozB (DUF420 family)